MHFRAAVFVFFAAAGLSPAQPADAVYYNGKIVTMSQGRPVAEAVAIRDGKFAAVGTSAEVRKLAGPKTRLVDLRGRTVLPGLNDSHTHPVSAALAEQKNPVPVMHSVAELQTYVRKLAAATPAGEVIFVPKVYATRLKDRRYPTREELDAAAPGRLVIADNGYASVLSTALLKKTGITRDTAQPPNGRIVKDAGGEPTGLILGAPQLLGPLRRTRPRTHDDILWGIRNMQKAYNAVGITSTIDRGQGPDGFRAYQQLRAAGELSVRTYVTCLIQAQGTPEEVRQQIEGIPFVTGMGDELFRVGSLKTVVDGGILIGTAYLREPWGENTGIYGFKEADYRGVLYVARENVVEMARTANRLGWQMTAHTAGGGATDVLLDAYEAAHRDKPLNGRRFTISHVNFPDRQAIERAKAMGVAFDCQPPWLHLDGPAIKDVFGPERMRDFLPFRSIIDAGVVVAGGSDHMIKFDSREAINPYNPFFGMWMAITRQTVDGAVLNPEQRITREEALRMWTVNGAYLSFEEGMKGTIEPGKLADMVVISKPFLTCPEAEIKDIEALETVVGGRVVYRSKELI